MGVVRCTTLPCRACRSFRAPRARWRDPGTFRVRFSSVAGRSKDKKASEMGGGVRKDKLADDVSGNACFELTLKGEGAHGRGAGESAQEDAGQEAASMNKPAKKHKKIVKF